MNIQIKRIYDDPAATDGWRVLVDRLWPRGIARESAEINEWAKEIAPSAELRKWYGHAPEKWNAFGRRYRAELKHKKEDLAQLLARCHGRTLTLLFAAKDVRHSHAVVLKQVLEKIK